MSGSEEAVSTEFGVCVVIAGLGVFSSAVVTFVLSLEPMSSGTGTAGGVGPNETKEVEVVDGGVVASLAGEVEGRGETEGDDPEGRGEVEGTIKGKMGRA